MLIKLKNELESLANKDKAEIYQRFFKTGKGEYGEGDIFMGITVPLQRKAAKKYLNLSVPKIQELLKSKIHEYRLTALFILINKYKKSNEAEKENLFNLYLENIKFINNWDLVDSSAHHILGDFLFEKEKKILYDLANSNNLWKKRISIIATFNFIRKNEFEDALTIAEILLNDKHDLIHKAVGWMLREIGNRDIKTEEKFLRFHYKKMPRTMLRYSIEKFPENKRKKYLLGNIS
ncbi:MAG: DNA alkylation repair protein [Nanoarchaeota archaeon]